MLSRVLKDGLTDPSQIPVREWMALDASHRQAIETRIDNNAAGTEPASNSALVDELATEMTEARSTFERRDLVPAVALLPLPQWQRFHDWQSGLRRNDPTTEGDLYSIRRGLELATKMLPANTPDDSATNCRADLVEEIDAWRRINGKGPNDDIIREMVERTLPSAAAVDANKSAFDVGLGKDCHSYCVDKCVGRGLGSEAPFCYWNCMKDCKEW